MLCRWGCFSWWDTWASLTADLDVDAIDLLSIGLLNRFFREGQNVRGDGVVKNAQKVLRRDSVGFSNCLVLHCKMVETDKDPTSSLRRGKFVCLKPLSGMWLSPILRARRGFEPSRTLIEEHENLPERSDGPMAAAKFKS